MRRRKQFDTTGCGLACIATLANKPYTDVRKVAISKLGFDTDGDFYTKTEQLIKLGSLFGVKISAKRRHQFKGWVHLPNSAILAINYNKDSESWHWVVFRRVAYTAYVIDPRRSVKTNRRTDFGRMKPFAFLPIDTNVT